MDIVQSLAREVMKLEKIVFTILAIISIKKLSMKNS
jgi:hypothetical protein